MLKSLVIRKMQIKPQLLIHYTGTRLAKIKKRLTAPDKEEDLEQRECSHIVGGNVKPYSHFGKQLVVSYTCALTIQNSSSNHLSES